MPWPVYTERLLASTAPQTWIGTTVPVGRRAIIKSVVALNSSTTTSLKVHCVAANIYFGAFVFQEPYVSRSIDLLAVAYGGEEIRVFLEGQSGSALITGWLLEDPTGRALTDESPAQRPEWPPPPSTIDL